MLEYSTRNITFPLTRHHPLLASELRAYQTALSKEDYVARYSDNQKTVEQEDDIKAILKFI